MAQFRCFIYNIGFKVKKTAKYFCLVMFFGFVLWINKSSNLKEVHTPFVRKNAEVDKIKYSSAENSNHSRLSQYRNQRKNICTKSRRFQSFKEPNGSVTGSKDFHLQQRCKQAPMQKIFESFGQDFGIQIEDPEFKKMHDFRYYSTPQYSKSFKNPCFYKNDTVGQPTQSRDIVRLHCVPYFMIAGFPKCGTTDLWSRLKNHPHVVWVHAKEINFFNKKQYDLLTTEDALDFYQHTIGISTKQIEKCVPEKLKGFNTCITGDASVDTIFDNKFWRRLPGNEIARDPKLTNADYVHKVNPNMKIIVLLREPVERLYSDYIYMSTSIGYVPSPADFHATVVDRISNFTSCRRHRNLRACVYDVYDDWNVQTYKVRLSVGIYHVFLQDWLKVFPRHNVLVLKSEDMRGPNATRMFAKILKFLDLSVSTRYGIEGVYGDKHYVNQRNKDDKRMLTKTKFILQDFYKAYNAELRHMLPYISY